MKSRVFDGFGYISTSSIHNERSLNAEEGDTFSLTPSSIIGSSSENSEQRLLHDLQLAEQHSINHSGLQEERVIPSTQFRRPPVYKLRRPIGCPPRQRPPLPPMKQTLALSHSTPVGVNQTRQQLAKSHASRRCLHRNIGPPPERLPPTPCSDRLKPRNAKIGSEVDAKSMQIGTPCIGPVNKGFLADHIVNDIVATKDTAANSKDSNTSDKLEVERQQEICDQSMNAPSARLCDSRHLAYVTEEGLIIEEPVTSHDLSVGTRSNQFQEQNRKSNSSSITKLYDAYLLSRATLRTDPSPRSSCDVESSDNVRKELQAEAIRILKQSNLQTVLDSGQTAYSEALTQLVEYPDRRSSMNRGAVPQKHACVIEASIPHPVRCTEPEDRSDRSGRYVQQDIIYVHNCVSNLCSLLSYSGRSHVSRLSETSNTIQSDSGDTDLSPLLPLKQIETLCPLPGLSKHLGEKAGQNFTVPSCRSSDPKIQTNAQPQVQRPAEKSSISEYLHNPPDESTWTPVQTKKSSPQPTTPALPSSSLLGVNILTSSPHIAEHPREDYQSILRRYARAMRDEGNASISSFLRSTARLESREDNPHKYYSVRIVDSQEVKIYPGQSLNTVLKLAGVPPILTIEDADRITGYGFVKMLNSTASVG